MVLRFKEISTVKGTGHVYFLVEAKEGDLALTEDFVIGGRRSIGARIVRDAQGLCQTKDGTWIDPETYTGPRVTWAREYFTVDLRQEYLTVIIPTMQHLLIDGWTGDRTADHTKALYKNDDPIPQRPTPLLKRDLSDPHGILARDDIKSLRDSIITIDEALWVRLTQGMKQIAIKTWHAVQSTFSRSI
jgi:hypothetical protein